MSNSPPRKNRNPGAQLQSEEVLQYNRLNFASMIKDNSSRENFLEREFDNGLKRHLCYGNFLVYVHRGMRLGKSKFRVVLPCVDTKIRGRYPDQNGKYTGFKDPAENL